MQPISGGGIFLRFIFALILVLSSYNPSGYSYLHWLAGSISEPTPWLALAGIVLIIAWVVYVRATLRSLGPVGLVLASVLVAVLIWTLVHLGVLTMEDTGAFVWLIEIFVAAILCIGMSWSHIRRRMSGQVDVDDIED